MENSTAHAAPDQFRLVGMDDFFVKPTLSAKAHRTLQVIQKYANGAWGFCGAFQRTLARILKRCVRWVAEAIAELKLHGLIRVVHRGPNASEIHVNNERVAELFAELSRPILIDESKSESTPRPEANPTPAFIAKPTPDRFDVYFGIFLASGKALGEYDRMRACRIWVSYSGQEHPGWQESAISDALNVCRMASSPQYVPLPVNHLVAKPWTRIAMPRTLEPEGKLSRMMREGMEILRRKGVA